MKRDEPDLCKESENVDDKFVSSNEGKSCLFESWGVAYLSSVGSYSKFLPFQQTYHCKTLNNEIAQKF